MIKNSSKLKATIHISHSTEKFQYFLVHDFCDLYEIPGLMSLFRYD